MRVVIKGIHKVTYRRADGTTEIYCYAWRGGPRMKAKPHTEAFAIEYGEHRKSVEPDRPLTLEDLITHFTGTDAEPNPDFLALSDKTQDDYRYAHRIILKTWPRMPAKLTQQKGMKREIRQWHRSYAANPRKADKLLFALSKVFSYAVADELIEKNPCTGIERLYSGSRKDCVWSPAQITLVRKHAPPHLLLPFELALNTAQRQGDVLALTWDAYDGTHLKIRQGKGGKRVKVRVHSRLKALLDATKEAPPRDPKKPRAVTIATNSRGRPWTPDGFKTSWGKFVADDDHKIEGVTFHDLRGTFITERRREGSSVEEIASVSGHSIEEVKSTLERHYLADDQQVSDAVILRMERNT